MFDSEGGKYNWVEIFFPQKKIIILKVEATGVIEGERLNMFEREWLNCKIPDGVMLIRK